MACHMSQPNTLSVRMKDIYVLIIAAFHSTDYFASCTCYIIAQAAIIIDQDEKNSEMRN